MRKAISILLCLMMICTCIPSVFAADNDATAELSAADMIFNFTTTEVSGANNLGGTVPMYDSDKGYGFVSQTSAMPSRTVDPTAIVAGDDGFSITESDGNYISYKNSNNYNYGGMVFRVDVPSAGAYKLKVTTTSSSSDTAIAPNGQQDSRLTSGGSWDSAGLVPKQHYAKWMDNTWEYEFATGLPYIEIEVEPKAQPKAADPKTVGISSIEITALENNPASGKPTVFVLGDSTQKTYTFEEAGMSGWGQIIYQMFDLDKVNVVNYSMGGRSMKSSHDEARFNDVLMTAKEGDFVLLHSAHNDESTGDSAGPEARFGRGSNSTTYPKWLNDIYIPAMKARGITPVLVTSMPRTGDGKPSDTKPNGFNPDSPGFMRTAAANDSAVELVELYDGAIEYINQIGYTETGYIYMSIEAGESPGKTNSGSYANGHPDNKTDGTHYKEAASKQWCRIIAQDIYDGAKASGASEKRKELASYLKADVSAAAASGDWSAVFPEMAKDVSNTGTTNAYYRNQIEKMLQLGVMFKDSEGNFYPKNSMNTTEFVEALSALWGLDVTRFEKYYSTCDLTREVMASIIYDAYEIKFGKGADGNWNKPDYMTKYNGATITPDDPNYDPNLTGKEAQYYPLVGWGNLTDKADISLEYAEKFYEIYNLGLMRSEKGIARGAMKNGTELQPKLVVSREKAAKELWFLWVLAQSNVRAENQVLTVPNASGTPENITFTSANYTPLPYEFESVDIASSTGALSVKLKNNETIPTAAQLVITRDGTVTRYDVSGSGVVNGIDIKLTEGQKVNMYVGSGDQVLSNSREVTCTKLVVPKKAYTVQNTPGIKGGTVNFEVVFAETAAINDDISLASTSTDAYGTLWWKASAGDGGSTTAELMPGLTALKEGMAFDSSRKGTVNGVSFDGALYLGENGRFDGSGTGLKFIAPDNGVVTAYAHNLGATKNFIIIEEGAAAEADALVSSLALGISGNCSISAAVEKGKSYFITVTGSKGAFMGVSFMAGAPIVSEKAYAGDTVKVIATPESGYRVENVTTDPSVELSFNSDKTETTFTMPEADVNVTVEFTDGSGPEPTDEPIETEAPTEVPTEVPTTEPTALPTEKPTESPSETPTEVPSITPTETPTSAPTAEPTETPTITPTETPSSVPTARPTSKPSSGNGSGSTWRPSTTAKPTATAQPGATDAPISTVAPTNAPTSVPVPEIGFKDVSAADWFFEAVEKVAEAGIMSGTSEDEFSPYDLMTRGMLVTTLGRMAGAPSATPASSSFADVDVNEYYAPYVEWAAQNKIVRGVGDGRFAPNDAVTREEIAVIVTRFMDYAQSGISIPNLLLTYTDTDMISDWAEDGVRYCTDKNFITGNPDGSFAPKSSATRAEVAAIISRIR